MHFYFANFNGAETTTVVDCKQYDYRPYLRLQGLNVTSNVEVEFSLTETGGSAVTRLGILSNGAIDVPIPDFIVEGADSTTNYRAFAFVRLRDKDSAWTEYKAVLYFESRPKPEHFVPSEQNSMAELLNQVKVIADDKVAKPLTGKVGQALVVKNVGADGKPMEFEAKDVSGGSVSPQEVENAVGDYLTKNPINVPKNLSDLAEDTTHRVVTDMEKQTWNGKANQTEVRQLKEDLTAHLANHPSGGTGGNGLTKAQINALDGMFKVTAFSADPTSAYATFKTAFGIGGTQPQPEPPTPSKTLQGISAVYNGGDVSVGTVLTDLTGLVVTAHYSDGSSNAVTGYQLSGSIAKGVNTITVTYQSKTTTFVVNGIEQTDVSNGVKWTDGVDYAPIITKNEYIDEHNGSLVLYNGWERTNYLYCKGATKIRFEKIVDSSALGANWGYNAFYDENKNFIQKFTVPFPNKTTIGEIGDVQVPPNACYFIASHKGGTYSTPCVKITPYAQ